MKNRIILMAAAIAAMMVSCQKEETPAVDSNYEVLTLTAVDSQETKTSLSGSSVLWTNDDVVAVFDAQNVKNEFKVDNPVEFSATAPTFSGKVSKGTQDFYAVYPYERANSANGSILSVTIPADQTSKVGSFAEEHNISVAKGTRALGDDTDCSVTFKNVCALLKFTLPAYITDAQKVTVSSNSTLAGDITVDYSGNDPKVIVPEDGAKSISMTGSFGGGSTFWFVLAPGEINGINVTVETAKTTYAFSTQAVYTIAAGNYKNLGTLKLSETVSIASVLAEHKYDDNTLTGTDIVVTLNYDAKAALYMSDLKIEVYYEEEEDNSWWENLIGKDPTILQNNIREFTSQTLVSTATLAGKSSESYPYIPSSDYKVRVSYKLGSETKVLDSEVSVGAPFNDGVHTVKATYDVYTSYTHYVKGTSEDIDKANGLDGDSIYADLLTINVSKKIREIYGSLITTKLNGSLNPVVSGSSFGTYSLTSIVTTFDGGIGETDANKGDYEITGIPYSYDFKEATTDKEATWKNSGWSFVMESGNELQTGITLGGKGIGGLGLHYSMSYFKETDKKSTKAFSPCFNIPGTATILIQPTITRLGSLYGFDGTKTYTCTVGSVKGVSKDLSYYSESGKSGKSTYSTKATNLNLVSTNASIDAFNITSSYPYICLDCDDQQNRLTTIVFYIYDVTFGYAAQ